MNFDEDCKFYVDKLFFDHYRTWEEEMNQKVVNDLTMLAKYKGELAKSFDEVKGQRNTLIWCMQEILERQEELLAIQKDLIKVITGNYPESKGRITAEEV